MANKKADGARIRALRDERMWSQDQLSEVSGVALRTIQRAEQGEALSLDSFKALGAVFKVDAEELVAKEAPPPKPLSPEHELIVLPRLSTATDLADLVQGHGYLFMNDDPKTQEETEALASFLDNLRDWGDIWREIGPGEHLKAAQSLREQLGELEGLGFWAFGKLKTKVLQPRQGAPMRWDVAHVVGASGFRVGRT